MEDKEAQYIADKMELDRTDEIFDVLIHRSAIKDREQGMGQEDIKKIKTVIAAGNLHISTARAKMTALKFVGHQENQARLKEAVQRRVKDALRPVEDGE